MHPDGTMICFHFFGAEKRRKVTLVENPADFEDSNDDDDDDDDDGYVER